MSIGPVVERTTLTMGALATAVCSDALAVRGSASRPLSRASWMEQIAVCRDPMMGNAWADTLRDAMRPAGAAAARLARVSDGQGVVVTTGQQPGLFGGPLYTLIKALSALALADRMEAVTGVPTAPVFWAATDDADFAEGATTWLPSGGTLVDARLRTAPPDGTMMSHAFLSNVDDAHGALRTATAGAAWPELVRVATKAYRDGATVGNAYVELMREILMPLGITVLNAAHPSVRHQSAPLLRRALIEAAAIDGALSRRTAELRAAGFAPQVELIADRSLVFVVKNGVKERATISGAGALLPRVSDDLLSPNVLLRPIVERALLPTVAYVAGPGELAYFAQVSAVAAQLSVASPLAVPRASIRIIPPAVQETLRRGGYSADSMREPRALIRQLADAATPEPAMDAIASLRAQVRTTADALHSSSGAFPAAALDGAIAQVSHRVDRLERRVLATSKQTIMAQLRRVEQAQLMLWPHGGPQERTVNPLPWLARYGTPLLDAMQQACTEYAATLVHDGA
jgi:bacillithiol synthase